MLSNHRTDLTTFEALDRLPPELFREVCFSARVWDAKLIESLYLPRMRQVGKREAIEWLAQSMRVADEQDVVDFAARHRRRYKVDLPHHAAEATILRYQPPVEMRNSRRRVVIPRRVRPAWRASEQLLPREGIDENSPPFLPIDRALAGRFANLELPAA